MTITLYDIPNSTPGQAWSPNTLRTRISLNYKGLDFVTEWLEYPDIGPTMKRIGANPTTKRDDGSGEDVYTLPAIYDSETEQAISDSFNIAIYLDEKYPDSPPLFPGDSRAAIAAFLHLFNIHVVNHVLPMVVPAATLHLNPPSQEYCRRGKALNVTLEECYPGGPEREEAMRRVQAGLSMVSDFYDRNGSQTPFFFGDKFSFADAVVVARLLSMKLYLLEPEWQAVQTFNQGRWLRLLAVSKGYYTM